MWVTSFWTTMPGEKKPDSMVADKCAEQTMKIGQQTSFRSTNSICDIPFIKPALRKRRRKRKTRSISKSPPCDYI